MANAKATVTANGKHRDIVMTRRDNFSTAFSMPSDVGLIPVEFNVKFVIWPAGKYTIGRYCGPSIRGNIFKFRYT